MGSPKPGHTNRLGEDETLERIRRTLGGGIEAPGLGDDAAVLQVPAGCPVVVSVDSVVEGVHVDAALCSAPDVGWKALMGALSDLAAMGARPLGALVALCVPESKGAGTTTLGIMEGVAEASRAARCPVIGGDVSSGAVLMVSVTVIGSVEGGGGGGGGLGPVFRSGARAEDVVLVTGPCGGSAAGLRELRAGMGGGGLVAGAGSGTGSGTGTSTGTSAGEAYRRPVARLEEGVVAQACGAHAMIDVSDGLALDLHRLADASGVGFALDTAPVAEGATEDEALGGGEDYELVLTMAEPDIDRLVARFAEARLRAPHRIGVITADPAVRTLRGRDLPRLGWQHSLG